jgi:Zn-dependent protease with chaperone function
LTENKSKMSTPNQENAPARVPFFKLFLLPALLLFLIPVIGWVFSAYALGSLDENFAAALDARVEAASGLSAEEKAARHDFVHAHVPSKACSTTDPDGARIRERMCESWGEIWQMNWALKLSIWSTVVGIAALAAALGLGALAFLNRGAQYLSFVIGWRLLVAVSALETMAQGVLAVWLSFWVPAYFFERYSPKLVAVFGFIALFAVFVVVRGIFKRLPPDGELEGELVKEADAPDLWARVRELARRIGTEPPKQIIAGIDANFFVSQSPIAIPGHQLTGRSLYVSLPLLRLMSEEEADAVLAHELAHFQGGDTDSSARLGPKIVAYDQYCVALHEAGMTRPVYYLMNLYRAIFEFALKREMREREFVADRKAAQLRSPAALVHALIKVSAYAIYRNHTERELFSRAERHQGAIGIAENIGAGLAQYAQSPRFVEDMQASHVPHPFDSHPKLAERMRNAGHEVNHAEYGQAVTHPPERTWAQSILTGPAIEQRLWGAYEERFRAAHERDLAYRYVPSNEEERALVLRYFPERRFPLKKEGEIVVSYLGMQLPGEATLFSWDDVDKATIENDGVLIIHHPEGSARGKKPTKIKLGPLGKEKDGFKAAFGAYWQRHQVMRSVQRGG